MKLTRRSSLVMLGSAVALMAAPKGVAAQNGSKIHEVKMLNFDPENRSNVMIFDPPVIRISPGNTVKFISSDPGHNAVAEPSMIPESAEPFRTPISKDAEVTLDTPGTYAYYCLPHRAMGMWGLVLVGDFTVNFETVRQAAEKIRGRGKQRMAEYLEQAQDMA